MKTLLFAATIAACLAAAPGDPVGWKLQDPPAAPTTAGARFNLKLLAVVQKGWHLYSLKPMAEGPIPTPARLARPRISATELGPPAVSIAAESAVTPGRRGVNRSACGNTAAATCWW